ncbi:MAG: hypothetical protein ACI3Y9_01270 [Candidatus Cryptobacteroides sp.]
MRHYYTLTVALIATVLTLGSCHKEYNPDQVFMGSTFPGLTVEGQDKLIYNPVTFQLGYSETVKEFRIHNDNMNEYLILTCSAIPSKEGQKINCDLKCISENYSLTRSGLSFKVEQLADDGTVWLWCGKKRIGVRVKILN